MTQNVDLINSDQLYRATRQALGIALMTPTPATLGWLDAAGARHLAVGDDDPSPDRAGKYYFTFAVGTTPEESASYGEAYNAGPTTLPAENLTFGRPVYVAKDAVSGDWYLAGLRPVAASIYGSGQPADPNPPGALITKSGLLDVTVPNSMRAIVYGSAYTLDNTLAWVDTITTDDLTASIPATASQALYVLVEVDPVARALVYKYGVPFPATLSVFQAWNADAGTFVIFPKEDANCFRAGYIRLVNGMTAITRSLLWSIQEIFTKSDYANVLVADGEVVTCNGSVVYAP